MVKRLSRIGNSYGLIIDRAILDLLGIDAETPLEVTAERGGLFVRPALSEVGHQKSSVRHSVTQLAKIHRDSLRELAE